MFSPNVLEKRLFTIFRLNAFKNQTFLHENSDVT